MTERSFQGITPSPPEGGSVTQVFGTKCHLYLRSLTSSLLESNLVVAQGQRHRAGRDTSIQIRPIGNLSDLGRPMRNGVAGRALEAFPGFPHGISHALRNRVYTRP